MLDVTTSERAPEEAAPGAENSARPSAAQRPGVPDLGLERGPVRTCVGCRTAAPKDDLVRLAIVPADLRSGGPAVVVDVARKAPGRGVHVHPTLACVRAAVDRGGIARAVRGVPGVTTQELVATMIARLDERLDGLLSGGRRARKLGIGTDAVMAAAVAGRVHALLVAGDAAGRSEELGGRVRERGGAVVTFRDKVRLGALVRGGRSEPSVAALAASDESGPVPEVGVVAILDPGIAAEVVRTLGRVAQLCATGVPPGEVSEAR